MTNVSIFKSSSSLREAFGLLSLLVGQAQVLVLSSVSKAHLPKGPGNKREVNKH